MQAIETIELTSAESSITFDNIPQTYTDLCIVLSLRNSSSSDGITLSFAGSTSNFSSRKLEGDGSSASSGSRSDNLFPVTQVPSSYTSNTFSNVTIYIPNYAEAQAHSFSIDSVTENNATTSFQNIYAGLCTNTTAIDEIVIGSLANNFVEYSSATLYGILAGSDGTTTVS